MLGMNGIPLLFRSSEIGVPSNEWFDVWLFILIE